MVERRGGEEGGLHLKHRIKMPQILFYCLILCILFFIGIQTYVWQSGVTASSGSGGYAKDKMM